MGNTWINNICIHIYIYIVYMKLYEIGIGYTFDRNGVMLDQTGVNMVNILMEHGIFT